MKNNCILGEPEFFIDPGGVDFFGRFLMRYTYYGNVIFYIEFIYRADDFNASLNVSAEIL